MAARARFLHTALLLGMLLSLLLVGCGKKGPLTLPDATHDIQTEAAANSDTPAASQTESGH